MAKVMLQIPMEASLKARATAAARAMGFSSLQESVRVLLTKLAQRELAVEIRYPEEHLSPRAERRYARIVHDIKAGKNVTKTDNLDQLFAILES